MRFQCPFCNFIVSPSPETLQKGERKLPCPNCHKSVFVPKNRFQEGCVIADFAIQRKLGEGSIGAVYEAVQLSLNRPVALKVLSQEYTNTKGITDFLREARAAAALNHPNLVQCFAVGEEDGTCYMAMNYIKGESVITKMKKEGKIAIDEALHIIQQVAEALYYAWDEAAIIHRDVKPDNIMLTDEGIVKLTDLGLAMHFTDWDENMDISGSPCYMAPEQFSGEKLDSRTDIYSLGVTLYHMLAGTLPFHGETVRTIAKQHFNEPHPPLAKVNPKIPLRVSELVDAMMAKHPDDRFQNMEKLLNAIWMIRQKTAPDRELVPDIHTISMKRLDYDLQKETARRYKKQLKARLNLTLKVLIVVLPLVIIATLVMGTYYLRRKSKDSKLIEQIEALSAHLDEKDVDVEVLEERFEALHRQLNAAATPLEREIKARARLGLALIDNRKLKDENDSIINDLEESMREVIELKTTLNAIDNSARKQFKEKDSETKQLEYEKERHLAQLNYLKGNLKIRDKRIASLQTLIKELKRNELEWHRDRLRVKLQAMIGQFRFKEAMALLKYEISKVDENDPEAEWLEERVESLKRMKEIYDALTDSGTKYAGAIIDDDCTVMLIREGKIDYHDATEGASDSTVDWDDISLESACSIVKTKFYDVPESRLMAEIALLRGNAYQALARAPKDGEIVSTCEALTKSYLESIRLVAVSDKKKAAERARILLRKAENTKAFDILKEQLSMIVPPSALAISESIETDASVRPTDAGTGYTTREKAPQTQRERTFTPRSTKEPAGFEWRVQKRPGESSDDEETPPSDSRYKQRPRYEVGY